MRKLDVALTLALGITLTTVAVTAGRASTALGNETVTYSYDALGRLTDSSTAGGPNNTRITGTCFDRAGNRMRYDVATSAPSTCPTPSPTPTPSP
jgi:hypothetical protein